jgi:hypothetical protein
MAVWEPSGDDDPPYHLIWGVEKPFWIDRSGQRMPMSFVPQRTMSDPDGLVSFAEGDFFGYSREGRTVIPPRYLQAAEFSEGRAMVVLDGPCVPPGAGLCGAPVLLPRSAIPRSVPILDIQSGRWRPNAKACQYTFINEIGEMLGPPRFHYAAAFREGMAPIRVDRLWGYVDKNLSVVVPPRYLGASRFSEGLAAVVGPDGFSYIDRAGNVGIPGPFDRAGDFHEGLAVVSQNQRSFYIDRAGRHAVPGMYLHAGRFFHGLANVQFRDRSLGYIDQAGRVVFAWRRR